MAANVIKGLAAAPGLASGRVFIWQESSLVLPEPYRCDDPKTAWEKVLAAIDGAKADVHQIRERSIKGIGLEQAAIFDAHLMMLDDPALHEMVQEKLSDGMNPEAAWSEAVETFAAMLEDIPDPLLSARAADVRDVGRRVLAHLLGKSENEHHLTEPSVVVARDLAPSQTAMLEPSLVLAFCTAEGGPTSHTAILAKALGIPAVVALGSDIMALTGGVEVLVDAEFGQVFVQPDSEEKQAFAARCAALSDHQSASLRTASQPAITRDGLRVEVVANIGGVEDARLAIAQGAEGVGLFRTEFLYLNRSSMPGIEQQAAVYRQVFDVMENRPVVVRTLDIGGDKQVDYLSIVEEPNPFLGWRGIRMIDRRPDIFHDQFVALLRAGKGADLRIMLPMVSALEEVLAARRILEEAVAAVRSQIPGYEPKVQFGMMVEVPAAALMAEHFAPYVDFYSIGTNDLTQYTLAMDRMNARVSGSASPFSPAVLRLIERTVRVAHEHGRWVGMCGELAGDPLAAPFLLGIGLDEFSMSASAIPEIKRLIRRLDARECRPVAAHVLGLPTASLVIEYLKTALPRLTAQETGRLTPR